MRNAARHEQSGRIVIQVVRQAVAALIVLPLLTGCAFIGSPPLPQHGAIETAATPNRRDELAEIVERADILYLPTDRIRSGPGAGAGLRLLQAMRSRSSAVAVGWTDIDANNQSLLSDSGDNRTSVEELIRQSFESEERENCRAFVGEARERSVANLALRCAPGGTDQQCIAENIVEYFRDKPDAKLLVLIRRAEIETSHGVPFYVARKLNVRQLVLDSRTPTANPAGLLTGSEKHLQVVDRAPRPGDDRP
jgi:hypothetical protein